MSIQELIAFLEKIAPPAYAESYDNCGLLVGNPKSEVRKALISLDCTESIVEEAVKEGFDIIIAHHPIVFSGIKKLNGQNYVERVIIKAIENKIALYAIHTNIDNVLEGVSGKIAEIIGLKNVKILDPKKSLLSKLSFYCPIKESEQVLNALFEVGAGEIGKYSECSFSSDGLGTFKANEGANPFIGEKGKRHQELERKIELIFPSHLENKIIEALTKAHPYEEIAYDLIDLKNKNKEVGSGIIGELEIEMDEMEFLKKIKKDFKCESIRFTELRGKKIKKVALCGGSGSFLLGKAKECGADVFVTADVSYHKFFDAENQIVIVDIGHYESEQFTIDLLYTKIQNKFPTFAVHKTKVNTNPIKYL